MENHSDRSASDLRNKRPVNGKSGGKKNETIILREWRGEMIEERKLDKHAESNR
jgi:hypothetical protein